MCTVCGCGTAVIDGDKSKAEGRGHAGAHSHDHDHHHHSPDDHDHHHAEDGSVHYGKGIAGVHVPGMSQERIIKVEKDILSKNDGYAAENRAFFVQNGIFALNFVSSPGSGKTSLLVRAIRELKDRMVINVIEGDQQTNNDAARIRETGARAIQINTGKGCHLDAHMVGHAVEDLAPEPGSILFIENVGNLVCPAPFELGEAHKVVVLSVTEGEDKPLKYPDIFAASDLMILNKSDLLPHLDFNVGLCIANALRVNARLQTLVVSARSGEGMEAFYAWLEATAARLATRAKVA
ncbi:hydrogenase nickel incorporation protein HypB [Rhizobium sp. SEMIA 4085]|uniref:Hydrogenase maturation factor HypB n=1 Tax=Rhizobium gallicum bv. gallicum R602sp TaxID=1041138 RepID=A0A0B4X691_9HYPH|nr:MULTISPECIES: hydrogenase nickel incorporation protein HypB [Rhizobium]AJD43609.1 hydrogenase nickel incorporation accessory protein HypB [Rhizobium gallicum bv. gallicum R602sp]NNH28762.1 hydrogenase nickel incorporation protein HypB [Rhizobium sp. SEMIA 4085]TDW34105.1 hydrogenase nickel incorporation protein HypB [Rhizobium azibense]